MKAEIKSVFQTLSSVSIKDKIERKGNLDYLSWANAWSVLKANYPNAERKVYEHEHTGFNYFTDGKSAWVKVGIVVDGLECIDYLPIMDFRNNALPLEKVTSTDVNKAIQRSTAKAIAMHGLGLSLWTGEDVPEMTTESTKSVSPAKPTDDRRKLEIGSDDWAKVSTYVLSNKDSKMDKIVQQLSRKYIISTSVLSEINKLHKV